MQIKNNLTEMELNNKIPALYFSTYQVCTESLKWIHCVRASVDFCICCCKTGTNSDKSLLLRRSTVSHTSVKKKYTQVNEGHYRGESDSAPNAGTHPGPRVQRAPT